MMTETKTNYRVRCSHPMHGASHEFDKPDKVSALARIEELNAKAGPAYRDVCKPWIAEQRTETDWEAVT